MCALSSSFLEVVPEYVNVEEIDDVNLKHTMIEYGKFFKRSFEKGRYIADLFLSSRPEYKGIFTPGSKISLETLDGEMELTLIKLLGSGGSKLFYELERNLALGRMKAHQVYEELRGHRFLEGIGILVNDIRPAVIFWSEKEVTYARPVFIGPTFESYMEKNAYVADLGRCGNIVEEFGEIQLTLSQLELFPSDVDLHSLEAWEPLISPLVKDLYKMYENGFVGPPDSRNVIFIGPGPLHSGKGTHFEVRAFPFDFSKKLSRTSLRKSLQPQSHSDLSKMATAYIEDVFWMIRTFPKYGEKVTSADEEKLIEKLIEKYFHAK